MGDSLPLLIGLQRNGNNVPGSELLTHTFLAKGLWYIDSRSLWCGEHWTITLNDFEELFEEQVGANKFGEQNLKEAQHWTTLDRHWKGRTAFRRPRRVQRETIGDGSVTMETENLFEVLNCNVAFENSIHCDSGDAVRRLIYGLSSFAVFEEHRSSVTERVRCNHCNNLHCTLYKYSP